MVPPAQNRNTKGTACIPFVDMHRSNDNMRNKSQPMTTVIHIQQPCKREHPIFLHSQGVYESRRNCLFGGVWQKIVSPLFPSVLVGHQTVVVPVYGMNVNVIEKNQHTILPSSFQKSYHKRRVPLSQLLVVVAAVVLLLLLLLLVGTIDCVVLCLRQ